MTTNLQSTFFTQCVPARILLAAGVYYTPAEYMKYWIAPAGLATVVGIYHYATYDKNQRGAFNQLVWWNNARIIYSIITIIFIILVANGNYNYAKFLPILDLIIGISLVTNHYSNI
jgi:hypothetical protein